MLSMKTHKTLLHKILTLYIIITVTSYSFTRCLQKQQQHQRKQQQQQQSRGVRRKSATTVRQEKPQQSLNLDKKYGEK